MRNHRSALGRSMDLGLPVGFDLLDERRRQRHIVERRCQLLAFLKRPFEEGERVDWLRAASLGCLYISTKTVALMG